MLKHSDKVVLTLLHLYSLFIYVHGDCHLKNSDKHSTNVLKRIKPLNGARFEYVYTDETTSDNYKYYLSICDDVQIDGYQGMGIGLVQEDMTKKQGNEKYVEIGRINSTVIKGGTDWVMLTYTNGKPYHSHCKNDGDGKRQAHIMIVCDPYTTKGTFKVLYEHNTEDDSSDCFYMMELTSNVVCNSHPTGLSSGSIFLIVFFTITGTYLLIGVLYKRCVYGEKGINQIPNSGFWRTCGSLQAREVVLTKSINKQARGRVSLCLLILLMIACGQTLTMFPLYVIAGSPLQDGCSYLCKCTESGYKTNMPYEGIADDQLDDAIDDEHLLPM